MPWQGNAEIMIDRFDVRAHLDYIPENASKSDPYFPDESRELRPTNYERYRILIQNNFLKIKEEKFLKTIAMEEKYGGKTYQQQKAEDDKKKGLQSKAAIGFVYHDSTGPAPPPQKPNQDNTEIPSDSDEDFDLDTVINLSALSREQQQDLNSIGKSFFLGREDFVKYLKQEVDEQEIAKTAKQEEDEKSAFSGRKSRKERRILKEKRLAGRIPSPPSYATYENRHGENDQNSSSENSSRSASPDTNQRSEGKVEYITTFGFEPEQPESVQSKKRGHRGQSKRQRPRSSSSSSSSDNGRYVLFYYNRLAVRS